MKKAAILAIIVLILAISVKTKSYAQANVNSNNRSLEKQEAVVPQGTTEIEKISVERERLEFEKNKYELDRVREDRKLQIEESKNFWSSLATWVPLVVGLLTIIAGFYSQYKQAKLQYDLKEAENKANFELKEAENKADFELKAAEIAFSGTTPLAIFKRGKILKEIFSKRLPDNFLDNFKPEEKEPSEEKKFFYESLIKYPQQKEEIIMIWFQLFPGDFNWLRRVASPELEKLMESFEFNSSTKEVNEHESSSKDNS
ncbi:MAG TPA: hypothetical protein VGB02_01205 [Pyrinomonadaceae bacterium]|jgi:hypothetical protein